MKKMAMLSILLTTYASAGTWDSHNDPSNLDENYQYTLSALPLKSILPSSKTPWASSYWPRFKGSINYRWNTPNPTGYNLNYHSEARVKNMTVAELAKLSPAEKFDLVQGHYNYPLSRDVAANVNPKAKSYEGICDGWTATAIQFAEPAPVEVTNPDGVVIPFGSADVKALMSYDVSINFEKGGLDPRFVGKYCSIPWGMRMGSSECKDVNPGAFHVILANQIGLKKESFAVDIDPGKETWNQPVYGFEFEIRGRTHVSGAASAYVVHAKFMFAEDDLEGEEAKKLFSWEPTVGTPNYAGEVLEYDYILELDYAGRIIGGSWLGESKKNHPDLLWLPFNKIEWTPWFSVLNKIYKPSFVE